MKVTVFCWMWLVAVVGRCVVGCEHCEGYCFLLDVVGSGCGVLCCRMRALVHPADPEQYTKCSNRAFVLLKMGIMMPETC